MSKLPLGECPRCKHPIWDNDADFQGHSIEQIHAVCIYCGEAFRFDLLAGKYVTLDASALSANDRIAVLRAQLMQKLCGPKLMADELLARNRDKKTS